VALFLTHGAIFIALKTEGDIRHEARALSLKTGVVAAVLAVVLLVSINVSTGSIASWVAAVVAAVALLAGLFAAFREREGWAFIGTFLAIGAAVATLFLALFPDVMPSTTNPAFSLTTTNASSTDLTLTIMTWVAAIFTPIVLLYTSWTYWTFRRRIGTRHIPATSVGAPH
jgi:cytochrome d ubiquinol oxidase subunit II